MGMAASQARLLSITARLSDNELKQQSLTYAKQRLADNSAQVNDQYLEALEKTKYQVLTGYNGVEACYEDISYNQLTGLNSIAMGKQYLVKDSHGKVLVSEELANAFKNGNGDFNKFLAAIGLTQADTDISDEYAKDKIHQAWDEYLASVGKSIDDYDSQHILDFGYNKFSDDKFDGYPTYDVHFAIANNEKTSLYQDENGNYYKLRKCITHDSEGKCIFNGQILENVTYNSETKKYTYESEDPDASGNPLFYDLDENGNKIYKEFDKLYIDPDNTENIRPYIENYYTPTTEDGQYQDEGGKVVNFVKISKALNYEGTTMAQRELYDYAVAITENYYNNKNTTELTYDAQQVSYYRNIFNQMATCGYTTLKESFKENDETKFKDSNWFVSQLKAGKLTMSYYSTTEKTFKGTTLESDGSIVEKEDKAAIAIAEQAYNSKMDKIEHQDKQFDLELNRLESEHNALQTEYDSVKKVISKNVQNSFKTFS